MHHGPAAPFDGRRAIVTGGASGIGRAAAGALAELGAHVVVTDIDEEAGAAVARDIGGEFATLDVSNSAAWDRLLGVVEPFDIGLLNAGITTSDGVPLGTEAPLDRLTDEAYRRVLSTNVDGVVFGARALLPAMHAAGRGDLVVTASIAGLVPIAPDPIYGLTKHAVVGFVRSIADGISGDPDAPDVCVSAICPGFADTGIMGDRVRAIFAKLGIDLLTPDNVADVIVRALTERIQGAQWVVWPGIDPAPYEWRPAVRLAGVDPA